MTRDEMLKFRLQLQEELRLLGEESESMERNYRANTDNLDREMREIRNKLQTVSRNIENELFVD